jgi:hypothetical protein
MKSRLLQFAFVSLLVVNSATGASAATVPTGFTDFVSNQLVYIYYTATTP